MKFRTKIDWWIAFLLMLAPIMITFAVYDERGTLLTPHYLWPMLIVAGVYGLVLFPITYEFRSDHLFIRAGLMRWRVPYAGITSIESGFIIWSGPALSLDRIKINYSTGTMPFVVVSPREKQRFLRELAQRAPQAAPTTLP